MKLPYRAVGICIKAYPAANQERRAAMEFLSVQLKQPVSDVSNDLRAAFDVGCSSGGIRCGPVIILLLAR